MRWKTIINYDCYSISDTGLARLDKEPGRSKHGIRYRPGDLLRLIPSGNYLAVHLVNLEGIKSRLVHQLVAEAFLPSPKHDDYLVCHLDGYPRNNFYKNLEWGNDKKNAVDMMLHGRCRNQSGSPIFSIEQVNELRSEFIHRKKSGEKTVKVKMSRELGINYWTLRDMLNNKSYAWVKE